MGADLGRARAKKSDRLVEAEVRSALAKALESAPVAIVDLLSMEEWATSNSGLTAWA